MKTYDIWIAIEGITSRIAYDVAGSSFEDACRNHYKKKSGQVGAYNCRSNYDPVNNKVFGLNVFSSRDEAKVG